MLGRDRNNEFIQLQIPSIEVEHGQVLADRIVMLPGITGTGREHTATVDLKLIELPVRGARRSNPIAG